MKRLLAVSLVACGVGDPSQSQACKDFFFCAFTVDGGVESPFEERLGPMGTCWVSDSQREADACTTECIARLDALKTANPGVCE